MTLPEDPGCTRRSRSGWTRRLTLLLTLLLAATVIAAGLCWQSVFVVGETQAALVLSFGRTARGPIIEAGLHVKRP